MFYPIYKDLKDKIKDKLINSHSYEFLLNNNIQMFNHKFETTEDIKITRFMIDSIEYKLNVFGVIGFFIYNKYLLCEPIHFIGEPNVLGFPADAYVVIQHMGKKIEFKNWLDNDNVIIMKNNKLSTTDNDIERIANVQAELDKSYISNIINSRLAPILQVQNRKDKKVVETAVQNILDGKPQTINLQASLFEDEELLKVIDVTDVNDSSKIQYLSLAKEDVTKRYFAQNGINLNSSVKQAQQSVAEITDGTNSAFVYPSNKYQTRCDCIEEFEDKFNIKYTVDFSECWKQQWDAITMSYEEKLQGGENNGEENVDDNRIDNNGEDSSNSRQSDDNSNE